MLNLIPLQTAAAESGGAGMVNILMIVAIIAVFYFFMIRPQTKRQKEMRKFRESLGNGSRVLTAGGLHGKIKRVNEQTFDIELAPGVVVTVEKTSVYPVGTSGQEVQQDQQK